MNLVITLASIVLTELLHAQNVLIVVNTNYKMDNVFVNKDSFYMQINVINVHLNVKNVYINLIFV